MNIDDQKKLSKKGNDFIDYFTFPQRLQTKGNKGKSFWDIYENRNELRKKKYINNFIKHYKKNYPSYDEKKIWYRIFNVYFGSIIIFSPIISMSIYCKYKPTHILDPTMGWGGRLLGACMLDIPKYTGIDLNKQLKIPYENMINEIKPYTKTKIDLYFTDSLLIDYSKIDYDMVFTSPPYYNIEIYEGTKKQTKEEWDKNFYIPLFDKTWNNLKKGGYFCLNVPYEIFERILKPMLGIPNEKIQLTKAKRTKDEKYKEFIYVWRK